MQLLMLRNLNGKEGYLNRILTRFLLLIKNNDKAIL